MEIYRSPEHWLKRAEEARTAAEKMHDAASKTAMLAVAENYEKIAKRAAARAFGVGIREDRHPTG